jgi:PAS domain S-box-containing protein
VPAEVGDNRGNEKERVDVARPPQLPQTETELEEFFELSIDPLSIIGFDGEFKRVNASFVRLLGYTKPELFSRSALDILHPDDVEPAREALAQLAEGHDFARFEARVICADGAVRWLEWSTRSMPKRGVVYSVGRDTTERRRVEAELREAQHLLEASRDELHVLAEEQAALRRVATLVAQDVPSRELFGAVAREVGSLFGADFSGMLRYEDDESVTTVATWAAVGEHPPVPARWDTVPGDPMTIIAATRGAARVDDWASVPGSIAAVIHTVLEVSSSVGCPIVVEGRLWGALAVHSKQRQPLPPDTESRIAQFTDLVGTAIANAESRGRADRLAEEQAALRRVATLVAKEASPADVFAKVAEEAANLLGEVECALLQDEGDGTASTVAAWGAGMSARFPVGTRVPADRDGVLAFVLREGRPRRIDDYSAAGESTAEGARAHGIGSAVGYPIVVGGGIWGAIIMARFGAEPCPPETESHVARFADLVATAIANAETRAEVQRLAAEQAALRRVATLVAEGSAPSTVLDAVAAEMERALGADAAMLLRYEPDDEATVVALRVPNLRTPPPGTSVSLEGENVTSMVRRTGRPARIGNYQRARGSVADFVRAVEWNVGAAVGAPIVVDGRLWGVIIASWSAERSPPGDTEERMAKFAELLDTAIANADSRGQLMGSRARLLSAGDEARRRVVRDLHDGAQQRLVHTIVTLKLAQRAFREEDGTAESLLSEALDQAEQGNRELRELAHGMLPTVLTQRGLQAGVDALVARVDLPVRVDVPAERLPAEIEASAYFIVAEALTNVVKHSHAGRAEVTASLEDGMVRIEVRDGGAGGADPDGPGLVGMRDRVTTLGGRLEIDSPAGGGTLVVATLPLPAG